MTILEFSIDNQNELTQAEILCQGNQYFVKLDSHVVAFALEILEQFPSVVKGNAYWQNRVYPFAAARLPKQDDRQPIQIWLNGNTFVLNQRLPQKKNRQSKHAHGAGRLGAIKAPMPGTVLQVLVREGETLAAHQPVIIMESMKMEMTLSAPDACIVGKIAISPNQLVAMHEILVELKPID